MFGIDLKSVLFQLAALVLALILLFSCAETKFMHDLINVFGSLNMPQSWKLPGLGISTLLFFYVIVK